MSGKRISLSYDNERLDPVLFLQGVARHRHVRGELKQFEYAPCVDGVGLGPLEILAGALLPLVKAKARQ